MCYLFSYLIQAGQVFHLIQSPYSLSLSSPDAGLSVKTLQSRKKRNWFWIFFFSEGWDQDGEAALVIERIASIATPAPFPPHFRNNSFQPYFSIVFINFPTSSCERELSLKYVCENISQSIGRWAYQGSGRRESLRILEIVRDISQRPSRPCQFFSHTINSVTLHCVLCTIWYDMSPASNNWNPKTIFPWKKIIFEVIFLISF